MILVGERFWRRAVDFDFLVEEGMIDADHLALFEFAETAHEIWDGILHWYEERNQSIFDAPLLRYRLTLLDLVAAVQDASENDSEATATLRHMFDTGTVRLSTVRFDDLPRVA